MSDSSSDINSPDNVQDELQRRPSGDEPTSDREQVGDSESTRDTKASPELDRVSFQRAGSRKLSLPADLGDFRLIRKIGEGGMGTVYEVEQKSLGNRRLALKTIRFPGDVDDRAVRRFRNEIQAVAQLEHRHIVPVYHVGQESGVHFYVMKYIEGDNLRQLIRSLRSAVSRKQRSTQQPEHTETSTPEKTHSTYRSGWSKGDTLASNEVLDDVSRDGSTAHPNFVKKFVSMAIQIADALHHVHQQGIVHRDIKPANLLVDLEGDVWLTDFGLAMIRDSPALTAPGDLVGTYLYMSPEQAMGSQRVIVDHRSDIYSLGVTLYELLTLKRASEGRSREEILRSVQFGKPVPIRKLFPRVPTDLETIVMKAMAKDPNARFQSAAELVTELRRFQAGKPLTIRPPTVLEKLGYWARANRQLVASLAAIALVTFIAAIATAAIAMQAAAETKVALESEKAQKEEVTRLLKKSEGLRFAAYSSLQVESDQTLALLLATEAAKRHEGSQANDAITRAMELGHEWRILSGHNAPPGHVAFNHDGSKLVSSAVEDEFTKGTEPAHVWNVSTGELLGKLQGEKTITSSVFSPDKFRILTASSPAEKDATNDIDDTLLATQPALWDTVTFQPLVSFEDAFLFKAHPKVFSPDGRRIVLPTNGNKAYTYDCVSGAKLVEFAGHQARVVFAAFNPRGDQVVTLSDDNTVRVWNATSGDQILELAHWRTSETQTGLRDIEWVEFSPDGRRLATGSRTRNVELWDLEDNGRLIEEHHLPGSRGTFFASGDLLATHDMAVSNIVIGSAHDARAIDDLSPADKLLRKVEISPDSRVVGMLDYSDMRNLYLWDLDRREMRATLHGEEIVHDLAFSPDSRFVATASNDKTIHLWHVSSGRDRATFPWIQSIGPTIAASSPDGSTLSLVTDALSPVGAVCDFEQVQPTFMLDARIAVPHRDDQRFLAIQKNRLAIHTMDDGSFTGLEAFLHQDVLEAAINGDGDRVAAFAGGRQILLWQPPENRRLAIPIGLSNVGELHFNADGDRLFAFCDDKTIRVWDADTGSLIESVTAEAQIGDVKFSPDKSTFAAVTRSNVVLLYRTETLELIRRFSDPDVHFDRVKFTDDGKRIVTYGAMRDASVVVWDVESGSQQASLNVAGRVGIATHPSEPEAIVWSDQEGTVIWRYEEDERLPVTDQRTASGAYSSDGQYFFLASWTPATYQASLIEEWPDQVNQPTVTRWLRDGMEQQQSIAFSSETIHQILVTSQDRILVNATRWYRVVNYSIASHNQRSTISGHYGKISSCFYTSDSQRLITTSWDGNVSVWNVADGTLVSRRNDHQSPIVSAALSRDDTYLVTGGRDGTCRVWNLSNGTVSDPMPLSDSPIDHIDIDQNSQRVLVVSRGHQAHLFQLQTGEPLQVDLQHDSIEWAELSPDGASILVIPAADSEGEAPTNVLIVPVDGTDVTRHDYAAAVRSSHLHTDSTTIVTTTADGLVTIQNARSGQAERSFIHAPRSAYAAVLDPSGDFVCVLGFDETTIWRVSDGRKWLTVDDRYGDYRWRHVYRPFLNGTPRRIVTRRSDTLEYRDWYVEPFEAAVEQLPRSLTDTEKKRFLIEE